MLSNAAYFTALAYVPQAQEHSMKALPTTGELFATNQVSPET